MKRTLGAAALLSVMLAAPPARGQAPLVVGSVRDQSGAPIVGATVTGRSPGGADSVTRTDGAGTFALHTPGITSVSVACRYCRTTRVAVAPDQPVVAIVRRYSALSADSPSNADLENLPYAHIESSVALRPFTLLAQTSSPYPGSLLSDRGLSASGALLVDDGTPNYDIVAGQSPYGMIPASYEQSAAVRDASQAYLYGDQAGGGVVTLDPFASGSRSEVATIGSDAIARAQIGSDAAGVALGTFSNDQESRQRTDLYANWPLAGDQSISFAGGSEQGRVYYDPADAYAGDFTFANATFSAPRALNLSLSAVVDRGAYWVANGIWPVSTVWSDTGFNAGVRSNGPVAGFADVSVRTSSGLYDATSIPYGPPRLAATLDQTRADAGFEARGNGYDITGGVGAFWFDYAGGTYGISQPAKSALAIPSLQAQFLPSDKWSVNLEGSGSFTLPTFVSQYLYADAESRPVAYQRYSLFAESVTYTDGARVRFSLEQASENVQGSLPGEITSSGVSAVWQIAPALSLRAWTMHVSNTAPISGITGVGPPYDGIAPTVNAAWMTYDAGAIRADLIYRRDLLDDEPFYHVDGAISGPIANGLRWYAGAEDRMRRTFVDAGIRFIAP